MNEINFIDEFYKIVTPEDKWDGYGTSIKEIFEIRLNEFGITQNQAEKLLGMEKRTLEGVLNKTLKRVDVINLLKLGQFLGLDISLLLKIYLQELSPETIKELEDSKKKSYLLSNFDLKNLHKAGFIKSKTDYVHIEQRINKYFGLKNIFDYRRNSYIPAFSKTKKNASVLMREFWVRSAYLHFEKINNPNEYDRTKFIDLIPKIRPYTMNIEKGLRIVTQALYNVGVTVIYQPQITTTQIRGATFIVNGKPGIVITDLNKNYATLWFALMHEIHHSLYDFDDIQKQVFHLTGEPDLFLLQEDKADEFSRDYLFPKDKSNYISNFIDSPIIVEEYALTNQIHPSIIYNFYCRDMEQNKVGNFWPKFRKFIPATDIALKELNINTIKKESIEETVSYLKEKIFNI